MDEVSVIATVQVITIDDEDENRGKPTTPLTRVSLPETIMERIENILSIVSEDTQRGRAAYLELRVPRSDVRLRKIELFYRTQQADFAALISLMVKCYELLSTGRIQNKRDIYYENIQLYCKQAKLDRLIQTLCIMLKVPRWDLNIEASAKGLIAGALQYKDINGQPCEVHPKTPTLIPSNQAGFHDFESDAKYILVVEKDAIFQQILVAKCFESLGSFLLLTGKGYPCYATRRFLTKLIDALRIPAFLLVDPDPHGLSIAATYRWGTQDCVDPELYNTSLQLLGVLPSELEFLGSSEQWQDMTDKEVRGLDQLQLRMRDEAWKMEVNVLKTKKRKAEIENISHSSQTYLVTTYLSSKIGKLMSPTVTPAMTGSQASLQTTSSASQSILALLQPTPSPATSSQPLYSQGHSQSWSQSYSQTW